MNMRKPYAIACRARQSISRIGRVRAGKRPVPVDDTNSFPLTAVEMLRGKKRKKVLIVVSPSVATASDELKKAMEQSRIAAAVWQLPDRRFGPDDIENLRYYYLGEQCDAFVVIGDDVAVDLVKAAAIRVGRPRQTADTILKKGKDDRKSAFVMAIPTVSAFAAGASIAELNDRTGAVAVLRGHRLCPNAVVLDAKLSEMVDSATLKDAAVLSLCRAVEAYVNPLYGNKISRDYAARAVEMILRSLEPALEGDFAARRELLLAGRFSALAVNRCGFGYAFLTASSAAVVSGADRAIISAVMLPAIMELYGESAKEILQQLEADAAVKADPERPDKDVLWVLRKFFCRLGYPEILAGVRVDDIPEIVERVISFGNRHCPAPTVLTAWELSEKLKELLPQ